LKTSLEALLTRLDVVESQQKALQSGKDRDVNKVRKESAELKKEFATFKAYQEKFGDDAEQRFEQDMLFQRLTGQLERLEEAEKETALAEQQKSLDEVNPELLKKYGIDPQSQEYLAQVKAGLTGYDAALAVAKGSKPPVQKEGDATGASGGAGGSSASQTAQKVLEDQYRTELEKKDHYTPREMWNLQEKYRKLGLRV